MGKKVIRKVIKKIRNKKDSRINGSKLIVFVLKYFNKKISTEICKKILGNYNGRGRNNLLIKKIVWKDKNS